MPFCHPHHGTKCRAQVVIFARVLALQATFTVITTSVVVTTECPRQRIARSPSSYEYATTPRIVVFRPHAGLPPHLHGNTSPGIVFTPAGTTESHMLTPMSAAGACIGMGRFGAAVYYALRARHGTACPTPARPAHHCSTPVMFTGCSALLPQHRLSVWQRQLVFCRR